MRSMTIGQVAREAGVGIETIRFYERQGLIETPPRRESGYRQYPYEVVARLQFIRRAKGLGFTLKEIVELLSLRVDPDATCGDIKARAAAKIGDIEDKIRALQRMKTALEGLKSACDGMSSTTECPILESLDERSEADAAS